MDSNSSRHAFGWRLLTALWLSVPALILGCSSSKGSSSGTGSQGGSPTQIIISSGGSGNGNNSSGGTWPPAGFTNVTDVSIGSYALGPKVSSGEQDAGGTTAGCSGGLMYGVVRDFLMYEDQDGKVIDNPKGHIDFQNFCCGDDKGITDKTLPTTGKPTYAGGNGTASTHGAQPFDQWYNDAAGVNMTYVVGLRMVQNDKVLSFSASINNPNGVADSSFFPLDGQGFGNEGLDHNYSFTDEFHTSFTYHGGETFTFNGDDDVWVYINGQLVIDLGGVHKQETQTVTLDDLGLAVGKVYPMAIFNAERHTTESNFRVDTTLAFTDCGEINGVPIK